MVSLYLLLEETFVQVQALQQLWRGPPSQVPAYLVRSLEKSMECLWNWRGSNCFRNKSDESWLDTGWQAENATIKHLLLSPAGSIKGLVSSRVNLQESWCIVGAIGVLSWLPVTGWWIHFPAPVGHWWPAVVTFPWVTFTQDKPLAEKEPPAWEFVHCSSQAAWSVWTTKRYEMLGSHSIRQDFSHQPPLLTKAHPQ